VVGEVIPDLGGRKNKAPSLDHLPPVMEACVIAQDQFSYPVKREREQGNEKEIIVIPCAIETVQKELKVNGYGVGLYVSPHLP
jgi:hypothetical protein